MMNFEIVTDLSVYDINRDYKDDSYTERLSEEQNKKIDELGLNMFSDYTIHFFDSVFMDETTENIDIYTAIEYLAIKDGADLVQFINGNYGFVAYYNGNRNGFEIVA